MGIYLNPGNDAFRQIKKETYIDKTGMIALINGTLETFHKMTCITRPRRFGKSFAAYMLSAYYDRSCHSKELFADLAIGRDADFEKYLNRYDVIYLDMTYFISIVSDFKDIVAELQKGIIEELRQAYPAYVKENEHALPSAVVDVVAKTGIKFIFIIDEWDAIFREKRSDTEIQKEYVTLLRGLFKGGMATANAIAGAYITGILPIRKYGTQSAMTDFHEYTMLDPAFTAPWIGFTEEEVKKLCVQFQLDFDKMKQWYDGYRLCGVDRTYSMYSPNSVMQAVTRRKYANYWTKTESYEALTEYINMNMDGLRDSLIAMLGGEKVRIDPASFQNDLVSFVYKDDVLTLLVHLGYLTFEEDTQLVSIPNQEVADSFRYAVRGNGWEMINQALRDSDLLLEQTIRGDEQAVAKALDNIHSSTSSVLRYHDENSLSCALTIAYYTARREYLIVRELPAGKGFCDLAFIPRKNSGYPAMIMELKYDQDADTAIRQIQEKRYDGQLKEYAGRILLVGINYNRKTKMHVCRIMQAEK